MKNIAKVMKYEFLQSSRILVPLYGMIIVLALLAGLSYNTRFSDEDFNDGFNYEFNYSSSNNDLIVNNHKIEGVNAAATGLLIFAMSVLATATGFLLLFTVVKRFKKSLLGDEAYLNLTLPVTIGEHIWGRFLMDLIWFLLYIIVIAASGFLSFWKVFQFINFGQLLKEFNGTGVSFWKIMNFSMLVIISLCVYLIALGFFVNSVGHLAKKDRTIVRFILVVIMINVSGYVLNLFTQNINFSSISEFSDMWPVLQYNMLATVCVNVAFTAIYLVVTHLILSNKVNLE